MTELGAACEASQASAFSYEERYPARVDIPQVSQRPLWLVRVIRSASDLLSETISSTDTLTAGWGASYFVECKSCQQEIIIDRHAPEEDTVTITGAFTAFPSCPHCGTEHQYGASDVQTRTEDS